MKVLVTGGAGFIGCHIVRFLIENEANVRVLDNLLTGRISNIQEFINLPNFEFIEGDITDLETCKKACRGVDFVSHQAALGSVPRSFLAPEKTNEIIDQFMKIMAEQQSNNVLEGSDKMIQQLKMKIEELEKSLSNCKCRDINSIKKNEFFIY